MLRAASAAFAILALSNSLAYAQWLHTEGEDDPFAGGAQQMAMTMTGAGEVVGFRCTSANDLSLLYVSIEKPKAEHARIIGLMPIKIMVIVDDEPVRSFEAKLDVTPDGDRYRATAEDQDLVDLLKLTSDAKRRFAIAVETSGERMYSAAVNVRGSRLAISKLSSGCGLP